MKYQPNQCKLIRERFRDHSYYVLCLTVFDVFQELCPTMVMTPEQLFADASNVLDTILCAKEETEYYCKRLWTNVINEYHAQDMTAGDTNTTTKVAMVFYSVMFALQAVNNSHYKGTLQKLLHDIIWDYYGKTKDSTINRCLDIERKLKPKVNLHSHDMFSWMQKYFVSRDTLTNSLSELLANHIKTEKTKEELVAEKKLKELTKDHELLATSNKVLREQITMNMERRRICFSKFVLFIEEHFVQKCQNTYEWLAVYMFADNNSLMCNRDQDLFCSQMQEWFSVSQVNCPNNFRNFTILIGRNPDEWQTIRRTKNLTGSVVENVTKRYTGLQNAFNIELIAF